MNGKNRSKASFSHDTLTQAWLQYLNHFKGSPQFFPLQPLKYRVESNVILVFAAFSGPKWRGASSLEYLSRITPSYWQASKLFAKHQITSFNVFWKALCFWNSDYGAVCTYQIWVKIHPTRLFALSWSLSCTISLPWEAVSHPLTCTFTRSLVILLLLAYLCVFGGGVICISWADSSYPVLSWALGLMTQSFLVTKRVPYTRQILDGRTPTVYLPV